MKSSRLILVLAIVVVGSIVLAIQLGKKTECEEKLAWKEFASLVHPESDNTEQPEWIFWATKCEVGLSSTCDDHVRKSPIAADRVAAELPRQIADEFKKLKSQKKQEFVLNYAAAPELAGVLYNPIAKNSILRNKLYDAPTLDGIIRQLDSEDISGAKRRLPLGSFEPGSEIVKLIWEIVPDADGQELRLYDPYDPPILSETQLHPITNWSARYRIDRDRTKPCLELKTYGSMEVPQTVPIACFYSFPIDKDNPCSTLSNEVQLVWGCDSDEMEGQKFLVFLVGFHVMKLTSENPDWVWSTYYWTRETNEAESNSNWRAPWNHFHQLTTTTIRENGADHALCSNPFLEGHLDNGRKANCVSCHSFAAYAQNVEKLDPGINLGGEYPYPKERRLDDELNYFRGAVQTSFVWSLSTRHNKDDNRNDPTSLQYMLTKVLQKQFQNR